MRKIEIFPTMITPYNKDGSVDFETAEKYVNWYYEKGCTGIFAICQSSEISFLSLDERIKINKTVWNKAKEIERTTGNKFTVVSSGHVSDKTEDQIKELNLIAESGTDSLILITNRLDINNEGDDVWIKNARKLLNSLPGNISLGLYECPLPYKRLVTPKILNWCLETGRFEYMKDTCCNIDTIKERLKITENSKFKLLNANCQTLLSSLKAGGSGYCGIMANFHPELYVWLCENFKKYPQKAELVQSFIGTIGFTESGMPYPLTAKYNMCLEGIKTENIARNKSSEELTEYMKSSTEQMYGLCKEFYRFITKDGEDFERMQ